MAILRANTLGIPEGTVRRWHGEDWWKSHEDDYRSSRRTKLTGQMESLKDKAVKVVEDRLDNGDWVYDQKLGQMVRKPINSINATTILRTALDKHLALEQLALLEKKTVTEEKVADRLAKLGDDFRRFAKAKEITNNAVHDQREEGLPEGESLGSQERGPADQGPLGTEYGQSDGGEEAGAQASD
jgi:hypothetical protein